MSEPNEQPVPRTNLHIDGNTVASNPGRVRVQWTHYYRCYPTILFIFVIALIAALSIATVPHFVKVREADPYYAMSGLGVVVVLFFGWSWLTLPRAKMMEGDTCPAVVLDPANGWIAVFADMTTSPGERFVPAIKVMRAPLHRSGRGSFATGERISTVALYEGNSYDGPPLHWSNFFPTPVVCATRDEAEIQRSLASVDEIEWRLLEDNLEQLPTPYQKVVRFL